MLFSQLRKDLRMLLPAKYASSLDTPHLDIEAFGAKAIPLVPRDSISKNRSPGADFLIAIARAIAI